VYFDSAWRDLRCREKTNYVRSVTHACGTWASDKKETKKNRRVSNGEKTTVYATKTSDTDEQRYDRDKCAALDAWRRTENNGDGTQTVRFNKPKKKKRHVDNNMYDVVVGVFIEIEFSAFMTVQNRFAAGFRANRMDVVRN